MSSRAEPLIAVSGGTLHIPSVPRRARSPASPCTLPNSLPRTSSARSMRSPRALSTASSFSRPSRVRSSPSTLRSPDSRNTAASPSSVRPTVRSQRAPSVSGSALRRGRPSRRLGSRSSTRPARSPRSKLCVGDQAVSCRRMRPLSPALSSAAPRRTRSAASSSAAGASRRAGKRPALSSAVSWPVQRGASPSPTPPCRARRSVSATPSLSGVLALSSS